VGLMRMTTERDGFSAHEDAYYKKQLEMLGARREGGLSVRLWLAEADGKAAAGAVVASFGTTATYLHGASDASMRQMMAPYLLHWRIMQQAKAQGVRSYDLWGTAPTDDPKHPWAGITRFKNGFGGRVVSYVGAWELPGKGFWYSLYRAAKYVRRALKR